MDKLEFRLIKMAEHLFHPDKMTDFQILMQDGDTHNASILVCGAIDRLWNLGKLTFEDAEVMFKVTEISKEEIAEIRQSNIHCKWPHFAKRPC